MKYIDITQTIETGMRRYPSDPCVKIARFKSLETGGSCNLALLKFGSHSGTHVDAPLHVFQDGKAVDDVPIEDLIRDVLVADIGDISKDVFFKKMGKRSVRGVVLKCGRSRNGLTLREARILLKNRIKLVGVDRLSIEEAPDKKHPVHKLLLSNGVVIIESLDLKKVRNGFYTLICLPLKIRRGDGAPARVVLAYD